jgi:hypothetical protein
LSCCPGRRAGRNYLPHAIGEGDRRTFRVCADSRTSSLYEPNARLLAHFSNLANPWRVVDRVEVQTVFDRLDPVKPVKIAVIPHEDLCALALRHYDAQRGAGLSAEYLGRLVS